MDGWMDRQIMSSKIFQTLTSVFAKGDETTLAVSYQQLPTAVKPGLFAA